MEPDAKVCFRVTGQPPSSEVCVKKPSEQDRCAARDRLTVSLADMTGAGRGLDASVVVDSGVVARGHVDALTASVTQDTLCSGFVGGGRSWKTNGLALQGHHRWVLSRSVTWSRGEAALRITGGCLAAELLRV